MYRVARRIGYGVGGVWVGCGWGLDGQWQVLQSGCDACDSEKTPIVCFTLSLCS
jgi:hypothetical protein